jgi:hypothetical protein
LKRKEVYLIMLNANAINWFTSILLRLEAFFHEIHAWFMGEDEKYTWPGRLVKTDSAAAKAFEAENSTAAESEVE